MRVLPHKGRKMVDDDEKGNHDRVSHECIKREIELNRTCTHVSNRCSINHKGHANGAAGRAETLKASGAHGQSHLCTLTHTYTRTCLHVHVSRCLLGYLPNERIASRSAVWCASACSAVSCRSITLTMRPKSSGGAAFAALCVCTWRSSRISTDCDSS